MQILMETNEATLYFLYWVEEVKVEFEFQQQA